MLRRQRKIFTLIFKMTAREILNNGIKLDDKFVDDSINAAVTAATDRINGNTNNDEYKKKIDEIRKSVEAKKQQEKRIAIIKASQEAKNNAGSQTSAGVSTPVQGQV